MLIRILAYFIPFAINFLDGGFFFITSYRFAEARCSGTVVASAIAAWGISYCLISLLIGRISNVANALKLVLTGGVLLLTASAGFILFDGLYTQFVWLVTAGTGAAIFCTPFQLFAQSMESGNGRRSGAIKAASFYTMTWSLGFASGPLAFAKLSIKNGFCVTFVLALAVLAGVLIIALINKKRSPSVQQKSSDDEYTPCEKNMFSEKDRTKLAVMGWIVGGLGTAAVCQIRSMWPKAGEELAISRENIAYILALVSFVQALTALSLCCSKKWMWNKYYALLMAAPGICGLILFASASSVQVFYAAAAIYGIYSGSTYFSLVYHSLAHPSKKAFFVAGNEVIVGVISMISPLIGGMLADIFDFTGAAFIFAASLALAAMIAQILILTSIGKSGEINEAQ